MNRHITITGTGPGRSLLDYLLAQDIYIPAFCGGKGTCGKCRVRFLRDVPAPSTADRALLTETELAGGIRLACTAKAPEGTEIEILAGDENGMAVETSFSIDPGSIPSESGSPAGEPDSIARQEKKTETGGHGSQPASSGLAAAVDIGTTTIAMSAVDTASGQILRTAAGVNHQRAWGADVISRIDASNHGKGDLLRESIRRDLDELAAQLQLPKDTTMVISGNTTMQHLLQGLSCETLGVAPYTPVDISLHRFENMLILPGISTYVGADIVSGIAACGMDRREDLCLLVDLGTNGEIALGSRDRILCASTAAGPAFEGGSIQYGMAGIPGAISSVEITNGTASVETIGGLPPAGICGTGVLETMYELLKEEIVDETGCMDDEWIEDGFPLAENIVFTAKDVREIQLAKAAIRAGIEVLLQVWGVGYDRIGSLFLAGGFGQKIRLEKAVGIGLLPEELLDVIRPIGNSSLAGAVMAAADPALPARLERIAKMAEEVQLAESPLFSDLYMEHMFFPEQ